MDLHPKVQNAGVAGSAVVVLVFASAALGFPIPAGVAAAVVVLVSFLAGYVTKSKPVA